MSGVEAEVKENEVRKKDGSLMYFLHDEHTKCCISFLYMSLHLRANSADRRCSPCVAGQLPQTNP